MKVKLHKGPMHGKVYDVDPMQLRYGIEFAVPEKIDWTEYKYPWNAPMDMSLTHRTARYELRLMSVNIGGRFYSAPAMHPDGSIFLTYVGD